MVVQSTYVPEVFPATVSLSVLFTAFLNNNRKSPRQLVADPRIQAVIAP